VKARQLIDKAAYGPDTLKVLFEAFDKAWAKLNPGIGNDPATIEAARVRLAEVILSFASPDSTDADRLAALALDVMKDGSRQS
jgi:hypothetical protein